MKTHLCDRFNEDLAAYAVNASSLTIEAASHVRQCAACQKKVAELKAVAAIHSAAASDLPEPKRSLCRGQVESALAHERGQGRTFVTGLRPIFACAVGLVMVAAVFIVSRKRQEPIATQPAIAHGRIAMRAEAEHFEPTMAALRREVHGGGEQLLTAVPISGGMRHYRVKDVQSELRN
jgi:hypothetical protein